MPLLKEEDTFAIVPVKRFENSKTRLSPILTDGERAQLAGLMLGDTLKALAATGVRIVVVSSDGRAKEVADLHGATFLQQGSDSGVNSAVALADAYCKKNGAVASIVVPQDLPLLDSRDIRRIIATAAEDERCIVICPSVRYDGTNVLLRRPPAAIKTHYDNNSYEMHLQAARQAGIPARVALIERLMFDVDTPADVAELAMRVEKNKQGLSAVATSAAAQFLAKKCRKSGGVFR